MMKARERGIGGIQVLIAMVALAALSLVAVPQYKSYVSKAKLTEAFNLAGASKTKLIEFYTTSNRFPRTAGEASSLKSESISAPEFVREMTVDHDHPDHDIVFKVHLKDGVVDNPLGEDQYVYIAADRLQGGGPSIQWSCGAVGIAEDLLPRDC